MINSKTKTKVNYEIFDVFTCGPYDVDVLDGSSDAKREVTIVTCVPGGARRVVCKAREV